MDISKLVNDLNTVRDNERDDINETMENLLKHSAVVLSTAELVREGKREDEELAAAMVLAADPTLLKPQKDENSWEPSPS